MTDRSSQSARPATLGGRRILRTLCATVFVDLLGFTLVLPSLPFYVTRLGGGGGWMGVLMAGYSLAQAVAAPILGRLADRYGRRRLVLLSLAGSTVSLCAVGLAGTLPLLLAARLVAGGCGGSIGVCQAFAADVVEPSERTTAMGRIGAATGLAFTVGPALGALAAPLGFRTMAFVAAGLAAANLVGAVAALPRDPAARRPKPARPTGRRLAPWPLLAAGFGSMAAFVGMETTVAFLAQRRFGTGPEFVGLLLCLAGLAMVAVQTVGVGWAARRWGEPRVVVLGAILMAAGLLALPIMPPAGFVLAVVALSAGDGLVTTAVASLLATAGPAGQRGARMGQGQAAASAARVVGPLGAGALFDVATWLPFLAGAALSMLAATVITAGRPSTSDDS